MKKGFQSITLLFLVILVTGMGAAQTISADTQNIEVTEEPETGSVTADPNQNFGITIEVTNTGNTEAEFTVVPYLVEDRDSRNDDGITKEWNRARIPEEGVEWEGTKYYYNDYSTKARESSLKNEELLENNGNPKKVNLEPGQTGKVKFAGYLPPEKYDFWFNENGQIIQRDYDFASVTKYGGTPISVSVQQEAVETDNRQIDVETNILIQIIEQIAEFLN